MINAPVAELAEKYRLALLKRDIAAATALLGAYGRAWNRLNTLQAALVAELAAKRLAGTEITAGLVRRSERYQALMAQLQDELRRLLPYTEETIRAGQAGLIESALDETAALAQAGLPGTPETRAALMTAWNRLPTDAAESLVGVLQDGSPLYQLLAQLGEPTAQGIGEALVNGIVLGWNPKRIAGELRDVFGLTTTRALRIARTEMLRSYRTASIMSYQENPQIVKGWQWSASKSLRTCIACLWNDGKVFAAQEFFPAHVNCRCSPVPVTVSWRDLGIDIPEQERAPTGQEWFLGLEPAKQEEILGGPVFRAWQAGKIAPEQFWHTDHDETWGDAYVASSLKHVLGDEAQEFYQ